MRLRVRTVVGVAMLLLAVGPALADTVILTTGDRISGEIQAVRDGKIIVKTTYAGEVAIDRASVTGFASETPVTVYLQSGDQLRGRLQALEGGRFSIVTDNGTVSASVADVAGLNAPPGGKTKDDLQAEIDKMAAPWTGKFELGAYWTDGNTSLLGGNTAITVMRETPRDKFTAKVAASYAEDHKTRITNEQIIRLREDVRFDPWYVFGETSFERDEFEDLDLRGILSLGAGRNLLTQPDLTADIEIAPTLTYSDYRSKSSEYAMELLIGFRAMWKVFGEARITEDLKLYPSLSNTGQFRLISETAFEQPLSEAWYLKLSLIDQYNSDVTNPVEKNDVAVRLSLVYNF